MTISTETRIYEGRTMVKEKLDQVLDRTDIDRKVIQKHGALCLNVEKGREIPAVAAYNPSKIVATEPNDGTQRAKDNLRALAELAPRFNASVRVQDDLTALAELKEQGQQFGIITNLNMFPNEIPYTDSFLKDAKEVTAPNGLIVTSMAEEEYRHYFDDIKLRGIPGLELDITESEYGVAGTVVLTAKKL